jgi:predicted MPP superfamily phosphohydrolase
MTPLRSRAPAPLRLCVDFSRRLSQGLSRRQALSLALGSAALVASDALVIEPRWLRVEHITIPVEGLGAAWQGARIALLSDTHCGPFTSPDYIAHAVDLANRLEPDLVLLLGDYVHGAASNLAPGIAPFANLQAREGVFSVLGNHDHWASRDTALRSLAAARVDRLDNRCARLSRRGDPLAVVGVGDLMEDVQLLRQALRHVPADVPRIVLSHNPDYAELMPSNVRVDLMVSGHTHGGQVQIPLYGAPRLPSRYGRKYQEGLVRGPHCPVYVTRGVSTISPPVRFLCRPEITLIQLQPA